MRVLKLIIIFNSGPLIQADTDNTIVGVTSGVLGHPGAHNCKNVYTYAAYVNVLHPWILKNLIRNKVDDVRVRGKFYFFKF